MNKKQYNNVIENTLKHEQTDDSLGTARAIFDNMGVALPQGDIKTVYETIKTDNYMGWKSCTIQEAQAAADNGTAAIGISEDRIVVLSANDEEQPVAQTTTVVAIDENTSAYAVDGLEYYSYSYGTTGQGGCGITTNSYITVGGWLKMYTKPTCCGSYRTVNIPTVAPYVGSDGYTYKFTDRTKWFSYENPYGSDFINPNFITEFEKLGKTVTVNVGNFGEYTDENGRYWMAVGPKVIIPNFPDNRPTWAQYLAGKGVLDVVVKDSCGNKYYIPGIVGDIKNHTWNNGVIQTYKKYPNGIYDSLGSNFNQTCAAEFIGALGGKMGDLDSYSIDSIRFYPIEA